MVYPKNPYIQNPAVARLYLSLLRHGFKLPAKVLGLCLGSEISCRVPEILFLPHPFGIVASPQTTLCNNVVLLQQVTLGALNPYGRRKALEITSPTLQEGVYAGPGAKILGPVTIGAWSVIGANAVVTRDVPEYSIVVGTNRILERSSRSLEERLYAEAELEVSRCPE